MLTCRLIAANTKLRLAVHSRFPGLTSRAVSVLRVLAQAETGLTQIDIVRRTGQDRSSISDEVRKLKHKGLVTVTTNKEDHRALITRLSPAGREAVVNIEARYARACADFFAELTLTERMTFEALLAKISGPKGMEIEETTAKA